MDQGSRAVRYRCARTSCTNLSAQLWKCAGCLQQLYCSRECQVTHWPQHKLVCQLAGPQASAAAAAAPSASASVASPQNDESVNSRDFLWELYRKYPNITSDDFAQFEKLLSGERCIWPDTILPIMLIQAPLSIVKIYVERLEQMVEHFNGEKAAGRPYSFHVNDENWPSILSSFLTAAIRHNPSEEVLRYLIIDKRASLPPMYIALLSPGRTLESRLAVLKDLAKYELTYNEIRQIRNDDKTTTQEEKNTSIARIKAQAEAILCNFPFTYYSPETLNLISFAVSIPALNEHPEKSFRIRPPIDLLYEALSIFCMRLYNPTNKRRKTCRQTKYLQ